MSFRLAIVALCGSLAAAQTPPAATSAQAPVRISLDQLFERVALARKAKAPKNVVEFQELLTKPEVCGRIVRWDSEDMCAILIYLYEAPSGAPIVRVAPVLFLETERITTGTLLEAHTWTDARKAYGLQGGRFERMWLKEFLTRPVSGADPKTGKPVKGDSELIAVIGMEEAAALGIPHKYRQRTGWSQGN